MSKRLLTAIALVAGVVALQGCVVVPAYPGYGHGYRHGYGYGYGRVVPPVYVTPWPYYRDRDGRRWERR